MKKFFPKLFRIGVTLYMLLVVIDTSIWIFCFIGWNDTTDRIFDICGALFTPLAILALIFAIVMIIRDLIGFWFLIKPFKKGQ